jgi:hypothetical protein
LERGRVAGDNRLGREPGGFDGGVGDGEGSLNRLVGGDGGVKVANQGNAGFGLPVLHDDLSLLIGRGSTFSLS